MNQTYRDELQVIFDADCQGRMPTIESRVQWAKARHIDPSHVHNFFHRARTRFKRKTHTCPSDDAYDIGDPLARSISKIPRRVPTSVLKYEDFVPTSSRERTNARSQSQTSSVIVDVESVSPDPHVRAYRHSPHPNPQPKKQYCNTGTQTALPPQTILAPLVQSSHSSMSPTSPFFPMTNYPNYSGMLPNNLLQTCPPAMYFNYPRNFGTSLWNYPMQNQSFNIPLQQQASFNPMSNYTGNFDPNSQDTNRFQHSFYPQTHFSTS